MNERQKKFLSLSLKAIICIATVIGVLVFGAMIQKAMSDQWLEYCDNKFGQGNWITKEVTGTEEAPYRFYIGRSWKCVGL